MHVNRNDGHWQAESGRKSFGLYAMVHLFALPTERTGILLCWALALRALRAAEGQRPSSEVYDALLSLWLA